MYRRNNEQRHKAKSQYLLSTTLHCCYCLINHAIWIKIGYRMLNNVKTFILVWASSLCKGHAQLHGVCQLSKKTNLTLYKSLYKWILPSQERAEIFIRHPSNCLRCFFPCQQSICKAQGTLKIILVSYFIFSIFCDL